MINELRDGTVIGRICNSVFFDFGRFGHSDAFDVDGSGEGFVDADFVAGCGCGCGCGCGYVLF